MAYQTWLVQNQTTLQTLTSTLAGYYRIDTLAPDLRERVAQAMHLKTSLNLSPAALDEACPSLAETLALTHMNLQQRYQETLAEVRDPNYLKLKNKPKPHRRTVATEPDAKSVMEQTP